MATDQFPCRLCGQTMSGLDSYVVCDACIEGFGCDALIPMQPLRPRQLGAHGRPLIPLSPDEIDARLRHLLNDW
ncbi:MAG: hypothetical protein U0893_18865 [Chloroflexota bacterium]